ATLPRCRWRACAASLPGSLPTSSGCSRPKARSRRAAIEVAPPRPKSGKRRSEEHTSELQSPCNLVCRLLLEKKKHAWMHERVVLVLADELLLALDKRGGECPHLRPLAAPRRGPIGAAHPRQRLDEVSDGPAP